MFQKMKLEDGQSASPPASRNHRNQKTKYVIAEDGDLVLVVGKEKCRILVVSQVLSMASVVFRTMILSQVVPK